MWKALDCKNYSVLLFTSCKAGQQIVLRQVVTFVYLVRKGAFSFFETLGSFLKLQFLGSNLDFGLTMGLAYVPGSDLGSHLRL